MLGHTRDRPFGRGIGLVPIALAWEETGCRLVKVEVEWWYSDFILDDVGWRRSRVHLFPLAKGSYPLD